MSITPIENESERRSAKLANADTLQNVHIVTP